MIERTIVISDIHGCYEEFNRLLGLVGYTPDYDRLLLLGDYVDRGPRSKEVVEQLIRLAAYENVIMLRGNHDQRFVDWLTEDAQQVQAKFMEHGGVSTLKSYGGSEWPDMEWNEQSLLQVKTWIQSRYADHTAFLKSLPLYFEDDHHIYVHAGLNPAFPRWQEQPERDFMWIRDAFFNKPTAVEKVVVFGHTQTMEIHDRSGIWFGGDKIGVDGGCAYGLQLNALVIRGKKDYQTYHVPAEGKGSNSKAVV